MQMTQSTKGTMTMKSMLYLRFRGLTGRLLAVLAIVVAVATAPAFAADLLHNSVDTSSTKWSGQGGWGVQGGKYGKFTCATCHEPDADNLKNIRRTINTMDGSTWPGGSSAVQVVFELQTSMGNDLGGHATSSRICEVCHSQNRFHNFNTANNTEGLNHPTPKQTCTNCHSHNTGFKAACGGCHGNPPTSTGLGGDYGLIGTPRPSNALESGQAGAHATHTAVPPAGRGFVCDTCHYVNNGSIEMPNQSGTIQIGFYGFAGKVTDGRYVPYSSATRGYRFVSGTANTTIAASATTYANANRCQNVYCHGGGSAVNGKPALGGGLNQSPRWDAAGQNSCGSCHGTTATSPPTLGSHLTHASAATGYSYSCDLCHPVSGDNSHVQGNVRWALKTADAKVGVTATYRTAPSGSTGDLAPSLTYGSCGNITCHSNGKGGAGNVVLPTWGATSGFANCVGCHGGNASSGAPIATGKHAAHINQLALNGINFSCAECHANTVSADRVIGTRLNHVNMIANYSGAKAGKVQTACNTAYCHSDGKGQAGTPVDWAAGPAINNCVGCHGVATTAGFASQAGEPNYPNTGAPGSLRANSHRSHTISVLVNGGGGAVASCTVCHFATVTVDGTAIKPGATHIDRNYDVTFDTAKAGASSGYNNLSRTCTNVTCHSGSNPIWGDAASAGCKSCHSSLASSGAHAAHIGNLITAGTVTFYNYTGNRSAGSSYLFGCTTCHPVDELTFHQKLGTNIDLSSNAPGVGKLRKLNKAILSAGTGYTKTDATHFYCDNVYCHSDGRDTNAPVYRQSPNWYGGSYTGNKCGMCHDNPPRYAGQSHYNPASTIGYSGKGTPRETGHLVGIHARNSYVGNKGNGFLGFSSSGNKAHGNGALSTTISCYICHSGVVSSAQVDTYAMDDVAGSQFRCSSCHKATSRTPLQPGLIVDTARHINGSKDIAFPAITFKTKAQLANVNNALGWSRKGVYKAYSSNDHFDLGLASWSKDGNGKVTCVTACHVNQPGIVWGNPLECMSCHAQQ